MSPESHTNTTKITPSHNVFGTIDLPFQSRENTGMHVSPSKYLNEIDETNQTHKRIHSSNSIRPDQLGIDIAVSKYQPPSTAQMNRHQVTNKFKNSQVNYFLQKRQTNAMTPDHLEAIMQVVQRRSPYINPGHMNPKLMFKKQQMELNRDFNTMINNIDMYYIENVKPKSETGTAKERARINLKITEEPNIWNRTDVRVLNTFEATNILTSNSNLNYQAGSMITAATRQMSQDSIKSENSNIMKITDLNSKFKSSRLDGILSEANNSAKMAPRHLNIEQIA